MAQNRQIIQAIIAAPQQLTHRHGVLTNICQLAFRLCATCQTASDDQPRSPIRRKVNNMKRNLFLMPFGIAAMIMVAQNANAQTRNCAPHQAVVERLAVQYGESRQSIGLGSDNSVVEVYASAETGSWTIVVTRPGGPACLVAAGQSYQQVAEVLQNTDQDT